jgi:predicted SprT family Zn-dependent metalloprotease
MAGILAGWLQAGCVGGLVVNGNSSSGVNGAIVSVKNCPACTTNTETTPSIAAYAGSWKFDAYDGDPLVLQRTGADAVRIRVSKAGFLTRTFFHKVEFKKRSTSAGDRYYDVVANLRIFPVGTADTDGDGLYDSEEIALGTNRFMTDTDSDGIPDGWEVWGHNWVDYKRLGCDPRHKDLLVDVDYHYYSSGGVRHSAKLSAAVVAKARELYGNLEVPNPDGRSGVNLILLQDDKLPQAFDCNTSYADNSQNKFEPIHRDAFRHASLCIGSHAGRAFIAGQKFFVREPEINADPADDQTEETQFWWYSTFVHELGHNLGLRHGGFENLNRKPNYPSLMNYAYDVSFDGSLLTLQNTLIQFSRGVLPNLDESGLSEKNSFPGFAAADIQFLSHYDDPWRGKEFDVSGLWVNWNRSHFSGVPTYQNGVLAATNINQNGSSTDYLQDHDDHATIGVNLAITLPADGRAEEFRLPITESILDQDSKR